MYNLESEEDCGCDNNYYDIINNSPLLNGQQENSFDPNSNKRQNNTQSQNNNQSNSPIIFNNPNSNNPNSNNQNSNNQNINQTNNINKLLNDISTQMPNNQMPNNQMPNNQIPNNQMPNNQVMNNIKQNNPINNMVLSNLSNNNLINKKSLNDKLNNRLVKVNLSHSLKYIVILLVAFAWHDVGKFYINKAIKYKGGSESYYLYYAIILTLIIYFIVKYN